MEELPLLRGVKLGGGGGMNEGLEVELVDRFEVPVNWELGPGMITAVEVEAEVGVVFEEVKVGKLEGGTPVDGRVEVNVKFNVLEDEPGNAVDKDGAKVKLELDGPLGR